MGLAQRVEDPYDRIDELQERVRQLEGLLEASVPAISHMLTAMQNRLLSLMLARDVASNEALYDAICYGKLDPPEPKVLHVHICKMRQRLEPLGVTVHTLHGQGYYITPEDKEKLRNAQA